MRYYPTVSEPLLTSIAFDGTPGPQCYAFDAWGGVTGRMLDTGNNQVGVFSSIVLDEANTQVVSGFTLTDSSLDGCYLNISQLRAYNQTKFNYAGTFTKWYVAVQSVPITYTVAQGYPNNDGATYTSVVASTAFGYSAEFAVMKVRLRYGLTLMQRFAPADRTPSLVRTVGTCWITSS